MPAIGKATTDYEAWLATHLVPIESDLERKHERMKEGVFAFLRATFYRWAQVWPQVCAELASAPAVLGVGDLHVENFGTWRDAEGRLVWGINDFDEAWRLAYTNDLVRLATSASLAIAENSLDIDAKDAAHSILEGYRAALEGGGRPFVLAERHHALREMATVRLRDPERFWQKLEDLATVKEPEVPPHAMEALKRLVPEAGLSFRIVHRVAGLGSLGRQRFVAVADWRGGKISREVKALAPSACAWAEGASSGEILYQEILDRAVRCADPFVKLEGPWIGRRLAPDCSRIELATLPKERDEIRLLRAMGFETANVHLGSRNAPAILADLERRGHGWLHHAAATMAEAVRKEWREWRG